MSDVFRMDEVRRSIARISFQWNKPSLEEGKDKKGKDKKAKDKKGKDKEGEDKVVQNVVIAGLIVSTGVIAGDTEESVIVLVDGTFFDRRIARDCTAKVVHLPNSNGGYEKHDAPYELIDPHAARNYLYALKLKSVAKEIKDYIRPLMFETNLVGLADRVYSFVFPVEGYITPTAYCPGITIDAHGELVVHGCHVHEYAHFGTPLLNERGNVIGINSGSQGRTQAWSVEYLKEYLGSTDLESVMCKISYLENGIPMRSGG